MPDSTRVVRADPPVLSLDEAVHIENRNQVMALQTQDFMQAVSAWAQKKTPEYKDK